MSAYVPARLRHRDMSCGNTVGPVGSIKETVDGFIRRIDFEPGYDCVDTGCEPRHGRHGMGLRFLLLGEEGATQFLLYTCDWLPGLQRRLHERGAMHGPMAADLGFHWLTPVYEGQDGGGACEYLAGAGCFYDGSGLRADDVLDRFLVDGVDAVWEALTEEWHHRAAEARALRSPEGGHDE